MNFKPNWRFGAVAIFLMLIQSCSSATKNLSPQRPWQKSVPGKGALGNYSERTLSGFGTNFVIRAWPSSKPTVPLQTALDLAVAEINRIAKIADADVEGSEVSIINEKSYKEAVPISAELASILMDCDRMYQLSNLRFDVTYTRYKNRSEFTDADFNRITDWDTISPPGDGAHRLFGDKNMILDTKPVPKVRLYNQRLKISLNGMMRGYAIDKAMRVLMKQGLGGMSVIADGFFAAIGTPLRDQNLLCIENPKVLGSCLFQIKPLDPRKVLFVGTSASQERPGKMFDPKEIWTLRSGGVVVSGSNGAWVQFSTTISAVMDDLVLNNFFKKSQDPKLVGVYFLKDQNNAIDGSLEPFAKVEKAGK